MHYYYFMIFYGKKKKSKINQYTVFKACDLASPPKYTHFSD